MSKIIKLKESDIKKIVKRVLKEQGDIRGTNLEEIVMNCIMENCSLKDISSVPQACIKMIVDKDITQSFACMSEMDSDSVQMILSKIEPISKCVAKKTSSPVMNERKLNEQPIDMACKSCVGKALGSKYSSKVEKAMMVLMSGKTPTMGDLTELLSDVDIMDGMVIGPKLLECVEFCSKPDFKGSPRMPRM